MKKMILAILLSAIMLLCGCWADLSRTAVSTEPPVSVTPEATPEAAVTETPADTVTPAVTETPLPAPKDPAALIEDLTARIKNDTDTGTFESFTKVSTLQDVFGSTNVELYRANVTFAVNFLGYPAKMECYFRPILEFYRLYVFPQERTDYEAKITDLLNKLEGALGSINGSYGYSWDMPAYEVRMTAKAEHFERTGELAEVYVCGYRSFSPADFPDIFPYPPYTEFDKVYENELRLAAVNKDIVHITYLVEDIETAFDFNKNNILIAGHYKLDVDLPDAGSAADFMEACMSGVQSVLGTPKDREYSGRFKTGEEIKGSGCDQFNFTAHWDGISLSAQYHPDLNGVELDLKFEEDYFKNAASGK